MDLLERDAHLKALDAWLEDAAGRTGHVVLITGEAGIGKTALVKAFRVRQSGRAVMLWGMCDALRTPRPLGPLLDIAAAAGGELAGLVAADAPRSALFGALLGVLAGPGRPRVVVVEDAHWADQATLDMLTFLGRRMDATRAVLLVTYRNDEVGPAHPLRVVLGDLAGSGSVERIELAPLSPAAVAALAGAAVDSGELHRRTGGNPFFVTEALAAPGAAVPASVRDAVLARAARLAPEARSVLEAAAVVPDQVELALLTAVTGAGPAAIDACAAAGMLLAEPGGQAVRFRHELARLAVEGAVPAARRAELHRLVLAALEARPGADPARLVHHAVAGGAGPATILGHAVAAGERAAALGAHRQAADHYALAVEHADGLPMRQLADLLERHAAECGPVERTADAVAATTRAIQYWRLDRDVEREGAARAELATLLNQAGRIPEAVAEAEVAVALLDRRPPSPALANACAALGQLKSVTRAIPEALSAGRRAVELAERFGLSETLTWGLTVVGMASWFADPDQAPGLFDRSIQVAKAAGLDAAVAYAMNNLGSGAGDVRRYGLADRWLRESIQWCADRDLDASGHYALAWLARTQFEQGRWSAATEAAVVVLAAASAPAIARMVALTVLGRLRARRGDPDPDTLLAEAWELASRMGDLQRLWPIAAARAEAAWLRGDQGAIGPLVADAFELPGRLNHPWALGELALWLRRSGALVTAEGMAEPYALWLAGRWADSAAAWRALGCPYEAVDALADAPGEADQLQALAGFERLGARPAAARVARRLRQAGVTSLPRGPRPATRANPAGLTARQLEILTLVAAGLRNAEIAARLHLSARTVGHHVSAILAKLGVASREEAAGMAAGLGVAAQDGSHGPPT
jgi:DNA-binding CsgD family transcriptional regulator/tetratricopeptide (TPR) repeat protein